MKSKLIIFSLLMIASLSLIGCGNDSTLNAYHDEMNSFYENMSTKNEAINGIDISSPTAVEDLLANLTEMDEAFLHLSELEVPEEFTSVTSLADEASEYMSQSLILYQEALNTSAYDAQKAAAAYETYTRAMKRVEYIGNILMGVVPEGENITVVYDENQKDNTLPN